MRRGHWFFVARDEAEGDSTPGSGTSPSTTAEPSKVEQQIGLLTQAIQTIAGSLDELKNTQTQMGSVLEALKPKDPEPPKPKTPEQMFDGIDLSQMDNAQLATLVMTKVAELVQSEVSKVPALVEDKVTPLAARVSSREAADQVAKLKDIAPDLFEWKAEMRQQLTENPTLNVQQAYTLAKAANPEKAAEMAKKYAPKTEASKKVFSLLPTGNRAEGGGKMSRQEAALAAFDEVFGGGQQLQSDTKLF